MTSSAWYGLLDHRYAQYRKLRAAKVGGMGTASRYAVVACACALICLLVWTAYAGRERLEMTGPQVQLGGNPLRAGSRKLVGEQSPEGARSEGEVGKEEKRAKKASNQKMLGEQQVPRLVQEEVQELSMAERQTHKEAFECDRHSPLTDVCTLQGDVRINVETGEIVLFARDPAILRGPLSVRPHPRKWDYNAMRDVTELRIRAMDAAASQEFPHWECTSHHRAPAAVFSAGGYCGGAFHDFNEVFLPLFQTVRQLARDVVLFVADLKGPWWWRGAPAADTLVGAMTKHRIRLLGQRNDTQGEAQGVQCFERVTIGLRHHLCMYDEFGGLETRSESLAGARLSDFGPFVAAGLRAEVPSPARVQVAEGSTPVVGIVQRRGTRVLANFEAMLASAEAAGYRAVALVLEELRPQEAVRALRQLDVLVAVHGAGLANLALLRPGAVVMQILPYGEWGKGRLVGREYRNLADLQGAKYLEWHVPLQDTSLVDAYPLTDPVLMDPDSVWREQHTVAAMRIYHQQNVSMPEDMFGAYLRHIKKDLVFKEKLRAESADMTM
ncbi:Glycosyltransferase family 61 protein [Klebsormidium nitens]|uniref:Glycosyltransferase family 61 protein n=1 Tax=Klebsormidium nitens TaxID=105231 RepID=A0A1Y1IF85_KLENI|nr:Glycosyltransferase family 61 protein [Klebsormidium nitens]|eukprot:GAQ89554.1 Glycosyltransferase family 61 protein [Klebsormidium nitens]